MSLALPLDPTVTIPAATNYLRQLIKAIFMARDFADVDQQICTAVKIMIGIEALALDMPQSLTVASQQQILVTLNNICNVYNAQMSPTI